MRLFMWWVVIPPYFVDVNKGVLHALIYFQTKRCAASTFIFRERFQSGPAQHILGPKARFYGGLLQLIIIIFF
jgi:hypothetical protein